MLVHQRVQRVWDRRKIPTFWRGESWIGAWKKSWLRVFSMVKPWHMYPENDQHICQSTYLGQAQTWVESWMDVRRYEIGRQNESSVSLKFCKCSAKLMTESNTTWRMKILMSCPIYVLPTFGSSTTCNSLAVGSCWSFKGLRNKWLTDQSITRQTCSMPDFIRFSTVIWIKQNDYYCMNTLNKFCLENPATAWINFWKNSLIQSL